MVTACLSYNTHVNLSTKIEIHLLKSSDGAGAVATAVVAVVGGRDVFAVRLSFKGGIKFVLLLLLLDVIGAAKGVFLPLWALVPLPSLT